MGSWLVFSAWREGDDALSNNRWMAEQTVRRAPSAPAHLDAEQAIRRHLEAALSDEPVNGDVVEGVALFGHGRSDAVMGSDGVAVLDFDHLTLLRRRWVHAVACHAGVDLVPASSAYVEIFVGYRAPLIVEFDMGALPGPLREHLARLVTSTTLGLLLGLHSRQELQRRANEVADDIAEWLIDHDEDGYLGLQVLAQQLVERMVTSREP